MLVYLYAMLGKLTLVFMIYIIPPKGALHLGEEVMVVCRDAE